jgi:hypothetical protein
VPSLAGGWALLSRPTKVALNSGVSFQLAVFAQGTARIASWKLTSRLLWGGAGVPIFQRLRRAPFIRFADRLGKIHDGQDSRTARSTGDRIGRS